MAGRQPSGDERVSARPLSLRARAARVRHSQRASGVQQPVRQLSPADALSGSRCCRSSRRRRIFRSWQSPSSASRTSRASCPTTTFDRRRSRSRPLAQLLKEPAELALLQELEQRGPAIDSVLESGENLRRAFVEAAQFGPAVDRFFTEIFVMVDDRALRKARLRLMKRLEQQILRIADISEIVSETE